jgi:hypothetical protein
MTIPNLLLRFLLVYVGLMLLAWIVLVLLRFENFVGLDAAMLFGAITIVSTQYAKKNGCYFSNEEKTKVILGMLSIDLVLQFLLLVLPALLPGGRIPPAGKMLFMLAVVGGLHFLAISLFVTLERRFLVKKGLIEG